MFKETLKRNKGITLIALVVTIIVLLILAGISISMLSGQNSTLNRAREAKGEYSNSTEKEQIQLSYNSAITKKLGESITAEELQNELNEVVGKNEDGTSKAEVTDKGNGVFNVKFIKTNHNYKVDNGEVTLITGEDKSVVEPENIADWEYDPNDDGTLTITGYKGSNTEVVIPNYIGGVKVKKISNENGAERSIWGDNIRDDNSKFYLGYNSIREQKTIKKIIISYGIEEIGNYAFVGTVNLENVIIPSTVTNMGICLFYNCRGLTDITIPSGVVSIGENTFSGCSNLRNITIPSNVTSIGTNAFYDCSSLKNIKIPSGVVSIEDNTFSGCSSLTDIEIPTNVTSIGSSAFSACSSLKNIKIPSGVVSIKGSTFSGCSSLTDIEIPTNVTSIGSDAFRGCSGLTDIEIPSNVTSIGSYAFMECRGLTNIIIPSGIKKVGFDVFYRNTFNNSNCAIPLRNKSDWLGSRLE